MKTKLTNEHMELLLKVVQYRLTYVRLLKNEKRPKEEKLLKDILTSLLESRPKSPNRPQK